MIQDRDNRKDFLFSALIVGICLWAFSAVGASSYSTTIRSKSQVNQVVNVSDYQPNEFVASVNSFPFNGNFIAIKSVINDELFSENNFDLIFNTIIETEFKSCYRKSIELKPEISKTSMDYILSSNMGVEYQSIS